MGWNTFKKAYKASWETFGSGEDAATLISDQYHIAIMTALGSQGAAVGGKYLSGNKAGLLNMLKPAFNATINGQQTIFKIGQQLQMGLMMYWVPGTLLSNSAVIASPGATPVWVDYPSNPGRPDIDTFLNDLVMSFDTHLLGVTGAIVSTPPVPFVGYKVLA